MYLLLWEVGGEKESAWEGVLLLVGSEKAVDMVWGKGGGPGC